MRWENDRKKGIKWKHVQFLWNKSDAIHSIKIKICVCSESGWCVVFLSFAFHEIVFENESSGMHFGRFSLEIVYIMTSHHIHRFLHSIFIFLSLNRKHDKSFSCIKWQSVYTSLTLYLKHTVLDNTTSYAREKCEYMSLALSAIFYIF